MFPQDSSFLTVDDSSVARDQTRKCLFELGYRRVLVAENVSQGKEVLLRQWQLKNPVHCVVLDVNMPNETGLSLVDWIRGHDFWRTLPIILATAFDSRENLTTGARLGISGYCAKPFDVEKFNERLKAAWIRHGETFFSSLAHLKAP